MSRIGDLLDDILDLVFCALDVYDFDGNGLAGSFIDPGGVSSSSEPRGCGRLTPCKLFQSCLLLGESQIELKLAVQEQTNAPMQYSLEYSC